MRHIASICLLSLTLLTACNANQSTPSDSYNSSQSDSSYSTTISHNDIANRYLNNSIVQENISRIMQDPKLSFDERNKAIMKESDKFQ